MANPINPSVLQWTAPITNADGTQLKDLFSYEIRVRATAGGPILKTIVQASGVLQPAPATTVTHGTTANPISVELALPDGTYLATVVAVDTAGNKSTEATAVPFDLNTVAPASPTGLTIS